MKRFLALAGSLTGLWVHPMIGMANVNTWTSVGPLQTPTVFHTSTLLPDGRVLVIGGQSSGGIVRRAELFNRVAGTWSGAANMSQARVAHTATLLSDGKVLIAGGWAEPDFKTALSHSEIYDSISGQWANTGAMQTPRGYHHALLLPSGSVLVMGGGGENFQIHKKAETYDPVTQVWTATGEMAVGRAGFAAVLLANGQVLVAGGQPTRDLAVSSAELYDPATRTWTPTGSMAFERADFTMVVLSDGKVLAIGGWNNESLSAETEVYDPETGAWVTKGPLNTPRYHPRAALLQDGKVLMAGGEVFDDALASCELYDPASGTWSIAADLGVARRLHSATLLMDGKFLVVGGLDADPLGSCELYNTPPNASPLILTAVRTGSGALTFRFNTVPIPAAAVPVRSATTVPRKIADWSVVHTAKELLPGVFEFTAETANGPVNQFYEVVLP